MTLDDAKPTVSSEEQHQVERDAAILYRSFLKYVLKRPDRGAVSLHRKSHASFLLKPLGQLPGRASAFLDISTHEYRCITVTQIQGAMHPALMQQGLGSRSGHHRACVSWELTKNWTEWPVV